MKTTLLASMVLALTLTACGKETPPASSAPKAAPPAVAPAAPPTAAPAAAPATTPADTSAATPAPASPPAAMSAEDKEKMVKDLVDQAKSAARKGQ